MWETYRLWQQDLLPGKRMSRKMVFNALLTIFGFVIMCAGLIFLIIELRMRLKGAPLMPVRYLPFPLSSVIGFFITAIAYRRTRYYTNLFEDVRNHLHLSLIDFKKRDDLALRQQARRKLRVTAELFVDRVTERLPYKVWIGTLEEFEHEYQIFLAFGLIEDVGFGKFFEKPKSAIPD